MSDPRVVLTLLSVAGAVVLAVALRCIRPKHPDHGFVVVPLLLAVAIWVPADVRNIALPVLFGVVLFIESIIAGCIVTGVTLAIGQLVPGGATGALLLVFGLVGFLAVYDTRKHLRRMRAAESLQPGQRPTRDVEVIGAAYGTATVSLPASEATCIAWWVETSGDPERASEPPIQIRADAGTAIVYPADVESEMCGDRERFLSDDDAAPILAAVGIVPGEDGLDDEPAVWLRWLEPGDPVYVVGRPVWEAAPAGVVETYRDSPALPTFRPDGDRRPFIANGSEDDVRRASTWSLWQWAVWGTVCTAIAVTQMVAP